MFPSADAQPAVSFIVASYNYGRFIGRTLRSIVDQTIPDFEIIVIDDASTDDSLDVVRSFNDPRIRLHVHERNTGLINTYNEGARLAKGQYVNYLDSDDWIEPRKLEAQLALFRSDPCLDIVGSYVRFFDDDGRRHPDADVRESFINQPYDFNAVETWIGANKLHACSVLLRRSVFDRIGLRDTSMTTASDYEFWARANARGCRFGMVQTPLLNYRLHERNASAQDMLAQFLEMAYTLQIDVLPKLDAIASADLVPQIIGWIGTLETFHALTEAQRLRLLGLLASPQPCRDCVEFKRVVLDDGNPTLTSLGRRLYATFQFHAVKVWRDVEMASRVATLKAERDRLRDENEQLRKSTSWRLTKPVRSIGAAVDRLRRR